MLLCDINLPIPLPKLPRPKLRDLPPVQAGAPHPTPRQNVPSSPPHILYVFHSQSHPLLPHLCPGRSRSPSLLLRQ